MPKNRIHKTKDKRYTYHFTDANGGRHSLMSRKDELRNQFSDRCDDADKMAGNASFDVNVTLDFLFEKWMEDYQSLNCTLADAKSMRYSYDSYVKVPAGHYRLYELKRANIYKILAEAQKKGLRTRTVSKIRACVSRPYNWAINTLHLDIVNPTHGLVMRQGKSRESHEVRIIADDDMQRFFDAAAKSETKWIHYFVILRETGMRPSECAGLEKKYRKKTTIQPNTGVTMLEKGPLKTSTAYRKIPITPVCAAALDAQETASGTSKWYFPVATGDPSYNAISRSFKKIVAQTAKWEKIGRKYHGNLLVPPVEFSLYDFRHTFATKMAQAGMPMKTLQYVMGHSEISTTMKYYIAVTDQTLIDACAIMSGQCSTKCSTKPEKLSKITMLSRKTKTPSA